MGQTISRLMMVRSRKMTNSSQMLRGSLEPRIRPPTSERYRTCVTDTTATMNLAISLVHSAIRTAGVSMSVKPTIIVEATAFASGT